MSKNKNIVLPFGKLLEIQPLHPAGGGSVSWVILSGGQHGRGVTHNHRGEHTPVGQELYCRDPSLSLSFASWTHHDSWLGLALSAVNRTLENKCPWRFQLGVLESERPLGRHLSCDVGSALSASPRGQSDNASFFLKIEMKSWMENILPRPGA